MCRCKFSQMISKLFVTSRTFEDERGAVTVLLLVTIVFSCYSHGIHNGSIQLHKLILCRWVHAVRGTSRDVHRPDFVPLHICGRCARERNAGGHIPATQSDEERPKHVSTDNTHALATVSRKFQNIACGDGKFVANFQDYLRHWESWETVCELWNWL